MIKRLLLFVVAITTASAQEKTRLSSDDVVDPSFFTTTNAITALNGIKAKYDDVRMRSLTAMSLVKTVPSIVGVSAGISGATYNARSGTVFVIRNVSGAPGNIYELTVDGLLVRTITNSNFIDTEAIEWVGYDAAAGADVFIVGEEDHTTAANECQLTLCRLTPAATTLDRTAVGNVTVQTAYSGGNIGNLGLEAIAYDSRRGMVYYTIEKQTAAGSDNTAGTGNAKIFQRSVTATGTLAFGAESVLCNINALFAGTLTDISDASYDANSDTILLLSDESDKVVRVSLAGTLIEQLATPANQPEGLAIYPDSDQLFIVGEAQEFYRYQLGSHRVTAAEAGVSVRVIKTSDTSRSSTTTNTADPDLVLPVGANEAWEFDFMVWMSSGVVGSTPGFSMGFTGPASPTALHYQINAGYAGFLADPNAPPTVVTVFAAPLKNYDFVTTFAEWARVKGSIINGPNAGTIAVAWSQKTSSATPTTVRRGSYLIARRLLP